MVLAPFGSPLVRTKQAPEGVSPAKADESEATASRRPSASLSACRRQGGGDGFGVTTRGSLLRWVSLRGGRPSSRRCAACGPARLSADSPRRCDAPRVVVTCARYDIGIQVGPGEGNFSRTMVLTLLPRYILVNNLPRALEFTQAGCSERWRGILPSGQYHRPPCPRVKTEWGSRVSCRACAVESSPSSHRPVQMCQRIA